MSETLIDLQRRAVSSLQAIAADDRHPGDTREVAEILVAARGLMNNDWQGRSYEYRQWVNETYTLAGISPSNRSTIQAAVGYHVSSVLHERFTTEQLDALGFNAKSLRERRGIRRERETEIIRLFDPESQLSERDVKHLSELLRRLFKRLSPKRREALLSDLVGATYGALGPDVILRTSNEGQLHRVMPD